MKQQHISLYLSMKSQVPLKSKRMYYAALKLHSLYVVGDNAIIDVYLADELAQYQLFIGDVPFLQVDTSLTGFTGDWSPPVAPTPKAP